MRRGLALVLVALARPAAADRHVIEPGETIEHVADAHGCTTAAVERANHLNTSIVKVGTVIVVPRCGGTIKTRARSREAHPDAGDDAAKAKQALAVIDGATWIPHATTDEPPEDRTAERPGESVGAPWDGKLEHATRLAAGDGYVIRRPTRAFGAKHVIEYLRGAIAAVRALHPDVHTLAIGDLSAEHGGRISDHHSHQSGLDVDVGFYFTKLPAGDRGFVEANSSLDLEATWALLAAFTRTASLDDGVQMIFLDYDVQRRLYAYAKQRGTPEADLAFIFQYPHGRNELSGLVRHWPAHANHMHVRFKR
ncbi:MAG: penicillin-insensitive murein endopeptidase [Kofleriaceae bacterium]